MSEVDPQKTPVSEVGCNALFASVVQSEAEWELRAQIQWDGKVSALLFLVEDLSFPRSHQEMLHRLLTYIAHLEISGRIPEGWWSRDKAREIEKELSKMRDQIRRKNGERLLRLKALAQVATQSL